MSSTHTPRHTHAHAHEDCSRHTEADPSKALTQAGLRNTRHRRMAYTVLQQSSQPLSTEAIFLALKGEDSTINLSTVYRLLEAFLEKGLVDKASTSEDGKALYEIASSVHRHHLHCLLCHRITVVEGCPLEAYEKQLEITTHFHVTGHKLELTGYCGDCWSKP